MADLIWQTYPGARSALQAGRILPLSCVLAHPGLSFASPVRAEEAGKALSCCGDYRPRAPPDCAMAAFCSWNLSPSRCEPFMFLSTHRMMQPSSREVRDLLSKLLMQSSKHRWTRLEYIYAARQHLLCIQSVPRAASAEAGCPYVHELLHLLLLHAGLQLALLCGRETGGRSAKLRQGGHYSRIHGDRRRRSWNVACFVMSG